MFLSPYFVIPSVIIVVVSVPLYLIILTVQWKYRHKPPFNSFFFKMTFHLGLFDLVHLFNEWVIGLVLVSYPSVLHGFIDRYGTVFARQYSMLWWYTALGRKLGVILLAVDRVLVIWFNKKLSEEQIKILLVSNWALPLVFTLPQAFTEFQLNHRSGLNATRGILLYRMNHNYQAVHYHCCFLFCGLASTICGVSYGLAFYKLYKQRRVSMVTVPSRVKRQTKLAIIGFIQFVITFLCSLFCGALVSGFQITELHSLKLVLGIEQLLFDIYSCINPYLILACSNAAMVHFKAVIFWKTPEKLERTTTAQVLELMVPLKSMFFQQHMESVEDEGAVDNFEIGSEVKL